MKKISLKTISKVLLFVIFSAVFNANSFAQFGLVNAVIGGVADKGKNKKETSKEDQERSGITSPIHEKYKGKFVFSSLYDNLTLKEENESAFSNHFTLGEPIYFRYYLANQLSQSAKKLTDSKKINYLFKVKLYLDNNEIISSFTTTEDLAENEKDWTSCAGALQLPGKGKYMFDHFFREFIKKQKTSLIVGDHAFKIELVACIDKPETKEGEVMAKGEFTLTVKTNSVEMFFSASCFPKAEMVDAKLEAKMMDAFKERGYPETPKFVRIVSKDWETVRHEYSGIILKRRIVGIVACVKDNKYFYDMYFFSQEYVGSSFEEKVFLDGHNHGRTELDSECMQ